MSDWKPSDVFPPPSERMKHVAVQSAARIAAEFHANPAELHNQLKALFDRYDEARSRVLDEYHRREVEALVCAPTRVAATKPPEPSRREWIIERCTQQWIGSELVYDMRVALDRCNRIWPDEFRGHNVANCKCERHAELRACIAE